jgi:hypothetical protein
VIKNMDRRRYYENLAKADNGNYTPLVNFVSRCIEQPLDLYLSAIEPSEPKNKLLSLAEAAKLTPYSQEYPSLLAHRGLIGVAKVGRNWQVTQNTLETYISNTSKTQNKR